MMLVIEALVLTFIMIINGNVVTNDPEHRLVQVMESEPEPRDLHRSGISV